MVKVGLMGVAHVHAGGFGEALRHSQRGTLVAVYDDDADRGRTFAGRFDVNFQDQVSDLLRECEAVIVCAPNLRHADLVDSALRTGRPALCEKPLAASRRDLHRIEASMKESGTLLSTAFPCPFSPAFKSTLAHLRAGDIGQLLAVNTTNRGQCPGGWFTDPSQSGGGAMIDHTVHVADLLWRLLGDEPDSVFALTGNNMHSEGFDDTAHVTLSYASGVFATIDASWSRPAGYRTWGDVNLSLVGTTGVIETSLFEQGLGVTTDRLRSQGTGSDLTLELVEDFLAAIEEKREPTVTGEDGLRASRIALAAYESLKTEAPAPLSSVA
ncbi:MAG: Gfo/Idh/MocA family oxidoreductase [Fimbriimonadaceae bacterium]|nr:Gfo/Idh/MocA family oxidoreductase [Fimbriimonadaceae bacterium]QYK56216.1 MAG: Gfo/Idh/MocA family oxidoreductase [Fimbriimonadaceae bacterium]